jgi:hypothetical protein
MPGKAVVEIDFPRFAFSFAEFAASRFGAAKKNRPYSISILMAFRNAPLISAGCRIDIVRCTDGLGFPASPFRKMVPR